MLKKHIATFLRAIVVRLDPPTVVDRVGLYTSPPTYTSNSLGSFTIRQGGWQS